MTSQTLIDIEDGVPTKFTGAGATDSPLLGSPYYGPLLCYTVHSLTVGQRWMMVNGADESPRQRRLTSGVESRSGHHCSCARNLKLAA